jgi:hypothetical protein
MDSTSGTFSLSELEHGIVISVGQTGKLVGHVDAVEDIALTGGALAVCLTVNKLFYIVLPIIVSQKDTT